MANSCSSILSIGIRVGVISLVNTKRDSCGKMVAPLNRNKEDSKNELKKYKYLALEVISGEIFD